MSRFRNLSPLKRVTFTVAKDLSGTCLINLLTTGPVHVYLLTGKMVGNKIKKEYLVRYWDGVQTVRFSEDLEARNYYLVVVNKSESAVDMFLEIVESNV